MRDDSLEGMGLGESDKYELIEELELNSPVQVQEVRERVSVSIDAALEVRPADIVRRRLRLIEGSARQLARNGLSSVMAEPVEVGSVYHLAFDTAVIDLAPVLAVCDKCVMLEPTAFGVHFQFTQPIAIPELPLLEN